MDNGETASGFNTRQNLDSPGVALPMNGLQFASNSKAFHQALDGSPVPRLPWLWPVQITTHIADRYGVEIAQQHTFSVIDLGPAKWTGNGCDLTPAAARAFDPKASATNFAMRATVRLVGAARFLKH